MYSRSPRISARWPCGGFHIITSFGSFDMGRRGRDLYGEPIDFAALAIARSRKGWRPTPAQKRAWAAKREAKRKRERREAGKRFEARKRAEARKRPQGA